MFDTDPTRGSGAPGARQVEDLISYAAWYGVAACVIALIVAVAAWGFAHRSGMTGMESGAKRAAVMALAGAVVIAAAGGLVSFALGLGGQVQ